MSSWFDNIEEKEAARIDDPDEIPVTDSDFEQDIYLGNLLRTTGQGVLMGGADEAEAAVRAAVETPLNLSDYGESYSNALQDIRANIKAFRASNPASAYGSEIAGSIAGLGKIAAPFRAAKAFKNVSAPVKATVAGGVYGFNAGEGGFENRSIDAAQNAVLSGTATKALKAVAPNISKAAQALRDKGIPLTPGQLLGGATQRIEQAASSVPFVGASVDSARRRAVESFNRVAIDDALTSIGVKVPKNLAGRDAYNFASNALDGAYEKSLTPIVLKNTDQLKKSIDAVITEYSERLPKDTVKLLRSVVDAELFAKFGKNGNMAGRQFKEIDSFFGADAAKAAKSTNYGDNKLSEALRDIKDELFEQVVKQNPNAKSLRQVDAAFRRLEPIGRAAEKLGGTGDAFSPAQLLAGVKANTPTVRGRKRKFAKGEAEGQKFAEQAKDALGTLPDSGTARNYLNNPLVLGGLLEGAFTGGVPTGTLLSIPTVGAAYTRAGMPVVREGLLAARRALPRITPAVPVTGSLLTRDKEPR